MYADLAQQHAALHTEVRRLRQGEAIDNAELLQRSRALHTVTQERDTLASQLTAARQAGAAKEAEVLRRGRGILGWARRAERAEGEVFWLRVEAAEKDAELGRRAAEIKALEARCVAAEEEVHRRREAGNEVTAPILPVLLRSLDHVWEDWAYFCVLCLAVLYKCQVRCLIGCEV